MMLIRNTDLFIVTPPPKPGEVNSQGFGFVLIIKKEIAGILHHYKASAIKSFNLNQEDGWI